MIVPGCCGLLCGIKLLVVSVLGSVKKLATGLLNRVKIIDNLSMLQRDC